jgi:hypothetical protein
MSLLSPFADYFQSRDVPLDLILDEASSLERVALVIASPTESTPPDLVERLELLDLISETQSMLNFEAEYHDLVNSCRDPDDTTADLAVKILLKAPAIAWREFDRQALQAQRSLVSFRVGAGVRFRGVTAARIAEFESFVAPWFEANARSGICHVHHREEPEGIAFVIRHGDMLKRIGILDEAGSQVSRILRPERVDIAHFRHLAGEWQISGMGAKIQDLYRDAFGLVFHGNLNALIPSKRYSLEPLREGPCSLECNPRNRVQFAELKSLKLKLPSGPRVTIEKKVFEALDGMDSALLPTATLLEAGLNLTLSNRKKLVQIRICPERDTILGATGEPCVDEWLLEHHFANDRNEGLLLASA